MGWSKEARAAAAAARKRKSALRPKKLAKSATTVARARETAQAFFAHPASTSPGHEVVGPNHIKTDAPDLQALRGHLRSMGVGENFTIERKNPVKGHDYKKGPRGPGPHVNKVEVKKHAGDSYDVRAHRPKPGSTEAEHPYGEGDQGLHTVISKIAGMHNDKNVRDQLSGFVPSGADPHRLASASASYLENLIVGKKYNGEPFPADEVAAAKKEWQSRFGKPYNSGESALKHYKDAVPGFSPTNLGAVSALTENGQVSHDDIIKAMTSEGTVGEKLGKLSVLAKKAGMKDNASNRSKLLKLAGAASGHEQPYPWMAVGGVGKNFQVSPEGHDHTMGAYGEGLNGVSTVDIPAQTTLIRQALDDAKIGAARGVSSRINRLKYAMANGGGWSNDDVKFTVQALLDAHGSETSKVKKERLNTLVDRLIQGAQKGGLKISRDDFSAERSDINTKDLHLLRGAVLNAHAYDASGKYKSDYDSKLVASLHKEIASVKDFRDLSPELHSTIVKSLERSIAMQKKSPYPSKKHIKQLQDLLERLITA